MGDTPVAAYAGIALFIVWALAEGEIHRRGLFQPERPDGLRAGLTWLQTAFIGSVIVGWLDAWPLRWTTFPSGVASTGWMAVGWIGVGLVVVGLVVRLSARITLAHNFSAFVQTVDAHRLVTHGLYAWVRHPAYTGFVGFLIGFPLALGSWASLAVALGIGVPALVHRIRIEEAALTRWFGDDYRAYADRTKRLLPGIW